MPTDVPGMATDRGDGPIVPERVLKRCRTVDMPDASAPTRGVRAGSVDDGNDDDADSSWRAYQTWRVRYGWPDRSGIVNMMLSGDRAHCEGKRFELCIHEIRELCRGGHGTIEHKVGICYDAGKRWEFYAADDGSSMWVPRLMVLLERPSNRSAAGFLEAALTSWMRSSSSYSTN